MNENTSKTASSLAITEKRPQRPGGCVGIFFQLFDWNRRFTKKKLFSKKLLTPARAKQSSSKFGGEEKLPKLRLIANENSGGFPNVKKNGTCNDDHDQNPGMQSPGLVAKLMGLDSMPAAKQDKTKKALLFESDSDKGGFVNSHSRYDDKDSYFEKGNTKGQVRPQKLQKTGPSEIQMLSRFGTEALQFKSVMSRSKKHRPKLPSPVKSPRMTTGRNACKLIDAAAAKILEPGLQATNRAKSALTCSGSKHHLPKDEVKMEETIIQSLNVSEDCNYHVPTARSLQGHSCKNCGSLVDVAGSSPNPVERLLPFASSVPNHVNSSFQVLERSKPSPVISSIGREKERVSDKIQEQPFPFTAQARNNTRTRAEAISKRKPINLEDEIRWHWTSQQCKPQKVVVSCIAFKHNNQKQNQAPLSRDRGTARSTLSSLQTSRVSSAANAINKSKDLVAFNRSLSPARSKIPVKVDNCKGNAEIKPCNRRSGLSPERKRRSTIVNQLGESSGIVSSTLAKQRNVRCDVMTGKRMGLNDQFVNHTCSRSIIAQEDSSRSSSNKDGGVISFMFSSPMKQKIESGLTHDDTPETSIKDKIDMKISAEKSFPLSGDALGALLEKKLKELTCQEEDELATGGIRPKRTSAMILQELISALTTERPISHDDMAVGSNMEKVLCQADVLLNKKVIFQAKEKNIGASLGYLHDGDRLSPGSVLEASFSNDSCFSSSLDDSSAPNLHPDSSDYSFNEPEPLEPDAELLDSATSFSKGGYGLQLVTNLLRHISDLLYSTCLADTGLKGGKLVHAEEVILNAELIFKNSALQNSNGSNDFCLSQFLVNELETLAKGLWAEFGHFLQCVEDPKHGNQLKQFLFDCVIEYLDSSYVQYCNSGFRAWAKMPLCTTNDMLITGIVGEVRRWTQLAGMIPDEIIETEMSRSLGKWTDFDREGYETGAAIDVELMQMLVDEIVIDLCEENMGFSGPFSGAVCDY
ncbi:hypothetical protein Vadar_033172 [Vaccinium darrowii]|uniref:Uncharacterized protein n=1 Tax=Vaccinium darrowii TaxID=229202 RepID=A0ACB7Y4B1_9ERIC|nr:hypothetical protein Vadar_033172 [Vaccinium darrowii]